MRSVSYLLPMLLALWLGAVSGQQDSTDEIKPINNDANLDTWSSFVTKFGRQYGSRAEYKIRKAIFESNVKKINDHNAQAEAGVYTYTMTTTRFADLTAEEFAEKYLTFRKPENLPTTTTTPESTTEASRNEVPSFSAALPTSFDLRTVVPKVMNPIQDQQGCGSCWAFGVMAHMETIYAKRYGKLLKFSEKYLVDCDDGNMGCDGGNTEPAWSFLMKNGIPLASTKPYVPWVDTSPTACTNLPKVANSHKFSIVTVPRGGPQMMSNDTLKKLVVDVGMVMTGVDGYALQLYSKGIIDGKNCREDNHLVNVVGYVATSTSSSVNHWIARNSWGAGWGENGYFRVAMNSNPCLLNNWVYAAKYY